MIEIAVNVPDTKRSLQRGKLPVKASQPQKHHELTRNREPENHGSYKELVSKLENTLVRSRSLTQSLKHNLPRATSSLSEKNPTKQKISAQGSSPSSQKQSVWRSSSSTIQEKRCLTPSSPVKKPSPRRSSGCTRPDKESTTPIKSPPLKKQTLQRSSNCAVREKNCSTPSPPVKKQSARRVSSSTIHEKSCSKMPPPLSRSQQPTSPVNYKKSPIKPSLSSKASRQPSSPFIREKSSVKPSLPSNKSQQPSSPIIHEKYSIEPTCPAKKEELRRTRSCFSRENECNNSSPSVQKQALRRASFSLLGESSPIPVCLPYQSHPRSCSFTFGENANCEAPLSSQEIEIHSEKSKFMQKNQEIEIHAENMEAESGFPKHREVTLQRIQNITETVHHDFFLSQEISQNLSKQELLTLLQQSKEWFENLRKDALSQSLEDLEEYTRMYEAVLKEKEQETLQKEHFKEKYNTLLAFIRDGRMNGASAARLKEAENEIQKLSDHCKKLETDLAQCQEEKEKAQNGFVTEIERLNEETVKLSLQIQKMMESGPNFCSESLPRTRRLSVSNSVKSFASDLEFESQHQNFSKQQQHMCASNAAWQNEQGYFENHIYKSESFPDQPLLLRHLENANLLDVYEGLHESGVTDYHLCFDLNDEFWETIERKFDIEKSKWVRARMIIGRGCSQVVARYECKLKASECDIRRLLMHCRKLEEKLAQLQGKQIQNGFTMIELVQGANTDGPLHQLSDASLLESRFSLKI